MSKFSLTGNVRRPGKGRPPGVVRREKKRPHSSKEPIRTNLSASQKHQRPRHKARYNIARAAHADAADKLTRELNHRLRNVFSTILIIVKHTAAHYPQAAEYRSALERRLRALSAATGLLERCKTNSISIQELIRLELAPFQEQDNVLISGPDAVVERMRAQDLAIVLHELTTNAVKHGSLSDIDGKLFVTWELLPDKNGNKLLCLEWVEQGGPGSKRPDHFGFGMAIIRESASILGGTASWDFAPEGFRYRLTMPAG
jgi:two-component sensor histidine kinase